MSKRPNSELDFNARITQFFLNNSRLTVLCLALVAILGMVATFNLNTSGFPTPEINILTVRTLYPGASSSAVKEDITTQLEEQLKDITEIETYQSTSANSASFITLTLKPDADLDSARSKISSALESAKLPGEAEQPVIGTIDVGGQDYIFALVNPDAKQLYDLGQKFESDLSNLTSVESVDSVSPIERKLEVILDNTKLTDKNISRTDITAQLETIGEELPVANNLSIDNRNQSLTTIVGGENLETIKELEIPYTSFNRFGAPSPKTIRLEELAEFKITYRFKEQNLLWTTYTTQSGQPITEQSLIIKVNAVSSFDTGEFTSKLAEIISKYEQTTLVDRADTLEELGPDESYIIEAVSISVENQAQVDEVVAGLVGGPLDTDNELLAQIGWLLGGIQLVFIVMMAFVSTRAAIVAALSIPLSLIFANIYLFLSGNDLNTLVLFSLVLVIGLVVDPALVTLESIQRKIDIGLRGRDAAIAAVKDVGAGLFLAALTNIIVFAPFGVISGILGEIFSYIPLTIIPAIIGSYIVPLVFLAWFGGLFLSPSKNKSTDEYKNLWSISKKLVRLNTAILNGSRKLRIAIVVLAIAIPLTVTGIYIGNGLIEFTQFSGAENGDRIQVTGTFLPEVTKPEQTKLIRQIAESISELDNVQMIYPHTAGLNYFVFPATEGSQNVVKLRDDINEDLAEFSDKFFTLNAGILSFTPPGANYQISLAINSENEPTLRSASIEVGEVVQQLCVTDSQEFVIDKNCSDESKVVVEVNDGFTDQETEVLEVRLDRQKLLDNSLIVAGAPQSLLVNSELRDLMNTSNSTTVSTAIIDGVETDVVLTNRREVIDRKSEIENAKVTNLLGQEVKIADVGEVVQTTAAQSITRIDGQTTNLVQAKVVEDYADQGSSTRITAALINYFNENDAEQTTELGLEAGAIATFSGGSTAEFTKSFSELVAALMLAIFMTYLVLVVFFESFMQPVVILFTVPLTFIGIFPALAHLGTGELGFLEIIGLIILVGIVENVAIFLIDLARQKIKEEGWDDKKAIAYASGVRFRPVVLTTITAIASLTPLAFTSPLYRPISLVIIFGLITSGVTSLFTTPILFVFFRWLSREFRSMTWYNQVLFFPLFLGYIPWLAWKDREGGEKRIENGEQEDGEDRRLESREQESEDLREAEKIDVK